MYCPHRADLDMLDIRLLQAMRTRQAYGKLHGFVPMQALEPATRTLLTDFGAYFDKFPDHQDIDYETFMSFFEAFRHPDQSADTRTVMRTILRRALVEDPPEGTVSCLLQELHELKLVHTAQAVVQKWTEGELAASPGEALKAALERYKVDSGVSLDAWVRPDMAELIAEELCMEGLTWPLEIMNRHMRPLRPGDFGIVAARPNKGKTTFLSILGTHVAKQLPPGRPVVWLNNEGPGRRIYLSLYRAALHTNLVGIQAKVNAGTLYSEYAEATGGDQDRIRILDVHGLNTAQVDTLLEMHNPGVIIYDMLDNIRWAGIQATRQDLVKEELYQWARERSVKYDCVGIATSQVSGEGEGMLYPPQSALKDSKTGKQGANDFILMIGASNDLGMGAIRGLSTPKSKLNRDGMSDLRVEVMVDYATTSYILPEDAAISPEPVNKELPTGAETEVTDAASAVDALNGL